MIYSWSNAWSQLSSAHLQRLHIFPIQTIWTNVNTLLLCNSFLFRRLLSLYFTHHLHQPACAGGEKIRRQNAELLSWMKVVATRRRRKPRHRWSSCCLQLQLLDYPQQHTSESLLTFSFTIWRLPCRDNWRSWYENLRFWHPTDMFVNWLEAAWNFREWILKYFDYSITYPWHET